MVSICLNCLPSRSVGRVQDFNEYIEWIAGTAAATLVALGMVVKRKWRKWIGPDWEEAIHEKLDAISDTQAEIKADLSVYGQKMTWFDDRITRLEEKE